MHTVLVVEDDPFQRVMVEKILQKIGYHTVTAGDGDAALAQCAVMLPAAVLMDIQMPGMDGMTALEEIKKRHPQLPVIMLTGETELSTAIRAMQLGAYDFLNKPVDAEHLTVVLANALKMQNLQQEVARLTRAQSGGLTFADLIGAEGGLKQAIAAGRKAAAAEMPVLIHGETGVGKELFARAIHGESQRGGKPFIAVNCGAIPTTLVESTLFGHEKGAFTGAVSKALGKFREAEGGTLFLDEVGELPPEAQVKLLRVLQQKEVEPVGAGKPVKVNVRIISATHRTLAQEVSAGRFREDLYFRLNVLPVTIPPLRERVQDVPALAVAFMQRVAANYDLPQKPLDSAAMDYLSRQPWPGNVRQLENLMQRAMVLTESAQIGIADIQQVQDHQPVGSAVASTQGTAGLTLALQNADGSFKPMDTLEQEIMQRVLDFHAQDVTDAAYALSIPKSTFYRKLKAMGG